MPKKTALRALHSIDWDFITPRKGYVSPLHWYPGTFVRGLSDAVVQALTDQGATVYDPYGGIGTTAQSALSSGRNAVTNDINPIANLVSYVTCGLTLIARTHPELAEALIDQAHAAVAEGQLDFAGGSNSASRRASASLLAEVLKPSPKDFYASLRVRPDATANAMEPWFERSTLRAVMRARARVREISSPFGRLVGLLMLSSTLRSVCSQRASWGHIADNVLPKVHIVGQLDAQAQRWAAHARRLTRALAEGAPKKACWARIENQNWSKAEAPSRPFADLLLTSPPYAGAIDYTLAQRLSLYLFGRSEEEVAAMVGQEIGARRKRFQPNSTVGWSNALGDALVAQARAIRPDGAICLVLPHKDSGRTVGENQVKATLSDLGWTLSFNADRSIHQSHTRQSWTSIKKETILVFHRG